MHILGLANGTPKGNSEVLLKAALHAATQEDPTITTSWIHVPSVLIPRNPPALQGALDISLGVNKSMLNRKEGAKVPAESAPVIVTTTTGETTTEASANATQPPNEAALDDTATGIVELTLQNAEAKPVTDGTEEAKPALAPSSTEVVEPSPASEVTGQLNSEHLANSSTDVESLPVTNGAEDATPAPLTNSTEDATSVSLTNGTEDAKAAPLTNGAEDAKPSQTTNDTTSLTDAEVDDRLAVLNAILDADAIIFSTPVYSRQPAGSLKAVVDRILGPYTDAAFAVRVTERRKNGDPRYQDTKIDERLLKPRVVGFICAAASRNTDQVTMALSSLHAMVFSIHAKVVDQIVCHGIAVPGMAAWMQDGAAVKRAQQVGRNIVSQIGKSFDDAKYLGAEPRGACPYCHLAKIDLLGTADNSIECVTCGAQGKLTQAKDGFFEPVWAEACDVSSITMAGKMHHLDVIEMGSKKSSSILSNPEFHRKKNEWLDLDFPLVDMPSQH